MQDAIAALEAALDELREARDALPDDLGSQLDEVIQQAEDVLSSLREKVTEG